MPLLPARHYVSDHTQFIRELLEKKPELVDGPAQGPRDLVGQAAGATSTQRREMDEGRVAAEAATSTRSE